MILSKEDKIRIKLILLIVNALPVPEIKGEEDVARKMHHKYYVKQVLLK